MNNFAIFIEGIGKRYRIGSVREKYRTLRGAFASAVVSPFRRAGKLLRGEAAGAAGLDGTIWALRDVSFEVRRGEVVGVVGRNGTGKSTLLKILSRITEPTEGRVRLRGRVGSLLEVGTGFHPELTGRENIYLNGAILGMKKSEINAKFDEIVAFAETERFLDTPVKHYSSGMHVRLAFAVAAHLEPEILLVDEVLAVGDAAFQKKCLGKMGDVAKTGRTVLFVSHNMAAVSALCSRAILLTDGRLAGTGTVAEIISKYLEPATNAHHVPLRQRTDRQGDGRLQFTDVTLLDEGGCSTSLAVCGKPLTILLSYTTPDGRQIRNVDMDVAFYGSFGQLLFFCKTRLARGNFELVPGSGQISCYIPKFPLNPGRYRFKLWCGANRVTADVIENAGTLLVEAGDFYGTGNLPKQNSEGVVMVQHHWDLIQSAPEATTATLSR